MGDLMRLFTDSDYFENQFNHAVKSYFGNVESSLKKTDKGYELVVPVADDATAKNVTVDFDDKDISKMKVITSLYDFLITNNIKSSPFRKEVRTRLEKDYIGFLSSGNSHILFREITETHEYKWIK